MREDKQMKANELKQDWDTRKEREDLLPELVLCQDLVQIKMRSSAC